MEKYGLLSPTSIITSLFLALLPPFLPCTDSALAGKKDAQTRRDSKSFLGSGKDNIQIPIVEENFFRCNRTHSVHDDLCIIQVRASIYGGKKDKLTRVSGETRLESSAIACASDKTPKMVTIRVNMRY